jgi:hypothetical protein
MNSPFKPAPKPQTKLGAALRKLAEGQDEIQAARCQRAARDLDNNAISLGARGERVKQLGAYYTALGVYRQVAGQPYEE